MKKMRFFICLTAMCLAALTFQWTKEVTGLVFQDGKGTRVVDLNSGKLLGLLPIDISRKRVVFNNSNLLISWLTNDYRIGIFDPGQAAPVRYLKTARGGSEQLPWHPLVFTSDGRHVVEWDRWEGAAMVRDVTTGKLVEQIPRGHSPYIQWSVECLAFSPDDKLLAIAGITENEKVIEVWDVASSKLLRRLEGHVGPVRAVAWSPDGRLLASASDDTTALIWDVSDLGGR